MPPTSLYPAAERALTAIALHRLLTTDQVHQLMTHRSIEWTRKLLRDLRAAGLVAGVKPKTAKDQARNVPTIWYCTGSGFRAAKQDGTLRGRRLVELTEDQVIAHTQGHTLAVNDACLALTSYARSHGGIGEWDNEVAHRVALAGSPDQYATADTLVTMDWQHGDSDVTIRALVELDRGTKTFDAVTGQMIRYVRYWNQPGRDRDREWHNRYAPDPGKPGGGFPLVLWVFDCDEPGAADRRLHSFAERVTPHLPTPEKAGDPAPMWVALCTLDTLKSDGPAGPVFYEPSTKQWGPLVSA